MTKVLNEVLAANARYADDFGDKSELPMPPGRRFAILTCMDARLDPAKFAGLAEGDAHVIRNAGGRASDDAIRSLVISYKLLGTREWFVIHHTDCGMETFTDEIMRGLLASSLETATIDKRGWRDTGRGPGSSEGALHRLADHRRQREERGRGRRAHPQPSAGQQVHPHLRLHLRREERSPDRGAGGERGRQRRFRRDTKSTRTAKASTKGRKAAKTTKPRPKGGNLPKRPRLLRPKGGSPGKRPKPLRPKGGSPAKPRQPDCACVQAVPSGIIPSISGAPATRGPGRENHPRRMLSKRLHARTFIATPTAEASFVDEHDPTLPCPLRVRTPCRAVGGAP